MQSNIPSSRFSQRILDMQHIYGTVKGTMDILPIEKEGSLMNILERLHM
jgi:hypothetical protein